MSHCFRGIGARELSKWEKKIPLRTDQRSINPGSTCRLDNLNKDRGENYWVKCISPYLPADDPLGWHKKTRAYVSTEGEETGNPVVVNMAHKTLYSLRALFLTFLCQPHIIIL